MEDIKIVIVIPAHNEAMTITKCLASVQTAIEQLPSTITATVLVVLDSCSDDTLALVKSFKFKCVRVKSVQFKSAQAKNTKIENADVNYLCCDYQCVGQVRDLGIRHAIAAGATWLAGGAA